MRIRAQAGNTGRKLGLELMRGGPDGSTIFCKIYFEFARFH